MTVKADTPYVRQDLRFNENSQNIHEFDDVLNLSTVLLNRLQSLSGSHALSPGISLVDDSLYGEALCDKCVANLQHILGYLQQSALDAIVHHYLRLVETQMLRWQRYRQYLKRIGEEWFAEWPNSQRPLSTTWPWNIKPSLLVLWGVCWMFYGDDEKPTGYPRRGAPVSEELGRGLTSIQSQQQSKLVLPGNRIKNKK